MGSLRQRVEADLATTLEGAYGQSIVLTGPDGASQTVQGQILHDTVRMSPESGDQMISNNPIVTVRRSTLNRIPANGETWHIRIPTAPIAGAPLGDYMLDPDQAIEGGSSIGFIRLYLHKLVQQDTE